MNILSKTLALSIVSTLAFAGISHAEARSSNFSVQFVDQIDDSSFKSALQSVQPDDIAAAQSTIKGDATLEKGLMAQGISPDNVIQIDTALDGSKIVYVR